MYFEVLLLTLKYHTTFGSDIEHCLFDTSLKTHTPQMKSHSYQRPKNQSPIPVIDAVGIYTSNTAVLHRVKEMPQSGLGDDLPLLLQQLAQLLQVCSRRVGGAHSPSKHVPHVL